MRNSIFTTLLLASAFWASISSALPNPASSAASSRTLGTLLVYPIFDIRSDTATEIRIVNYSDDDVKFHYNYVCPGIPHVNNFCPKLDRTISLTPHETKVIDVSSQHPPCNQGFVLGYPINDHAQPISLNVLAGTYKITSGREVDQDDAIAITSVRPSGAVLGGSSGFSFTAGPNQDFTSLAPLIVTDFKATQVNPDDTAGSKIVLLDLGSGLGIQNPTSLVSVDFWSSSEVPFSSSLEFICWTQVGLENVDSNFRAENLGTNFGTLQAQSTLSCPLPGGCPPLNPRAPLLLGVIQEFGSPSATRGVKYVGCDTGGSFDPTHGCSVPTATVTPFSTFTPTPTVTESPSVSPTATASPSASPSLSPSPTASPSASPSPTASPGTCFPADNTGSNSAPGCECIGTFDCCGICGATGVCVGSPRGGAGADPGAAPSCFSQTCHLANNAGSDSETGCPCIGTFDCCGICSATGFCTGATRLPAGADPGGAASCPQ